VPIIPPPIIIKSVFFILFFIGFKPCFYNYEVI